VNDYTEAPGFHGGRFKRLPPLEEWAKTLALPIIEPGIPHPTR